MSISLYMDENVHRGITKGVRQRQVDVLTVQEDNRSGLADPQVLDRATELDRVLFTQDQDFLVEAQKRQIRGQSFSGVIYGHQRLVTIGDCVNDLELIAKSANPAEMADRVQFLPL